MKNKIIEKEMELAGRARKIGDTLLKSRSGYMLIDMYGIALYEMDFISDLSIVEEFLEEHESSVMGKLMYIKMCQKNDNIDPFMDSKMILVPRNPQGEFNCTIDDSNLREYYRLENEDMRRQKLVTQELLMKAEDLTIVKC